MSNNVFIFTSFISLFGYKISINIHWRNRNWLRLVLTLIVLKAGVARVTGLDKMNGMAGVTGVVGMDGIDVPFSHLKYDWKITE